LSRTTLSRLDGALADLQDAVEGRPEDEDAWELLDEARGLQSQVEAKLRERGNDDPAADSTDSGATAEPVPDDSVPVDVDAELRSIKDEFGNGPDGNGEAGDGDDTDDAVGDGAGDGADTDDGE